jgi:endonuclease G, mitochondrial
MLNDPFQMQRELRYGAPVCDSLLTGRYFTIGYSWYFRQAKWTLEIVDPLLPLLPNAENRTRLDNFRADPRVPMRFRAGLDAYRSSGFDRGHLAASAHHDQLDIQNSETFLLSNMSPMVPAFNRGIWNRLEAAVRLLNASKDVLETYVLTAPVFYFGEPVVTIGKQPLGEYGIYIPVPHAFVKSVLAEDRKGRLRLWSFEMKNRANTGPLEQYLVPTEHAEQLVGGQFWDRLSGREIDLQKRRANKMWDLTPLN